MNRTGSAKLKRLVAVCYHLQVLQGRSPFFLGLRTVQRIADAKNLYHACALMTGLISDGLMVQVEPGNPKNRHQRKESERFKSFTYEELTKRDKVNLGIFWLKDDALEESANLPAPEVIAADITADLEAAMEQFATIAEDLKK